MALRPREKYYEAAEKMGMTVVTLDPPDVIQHITGRKTMSAINNALHMASLDCLKEVEKGKPILLDFCPIGTLAVEATYARSVGELSDKDITQYKEEWQVNWLPVLEAAGYTNIVVLADTADGDIKAKVRDHSDL